MHLARTLPAAGDTLHRVPPELRLVFSEPVIPRYTSLTLLSPSGDGIELGRLLPAAGNRQFAVPTPSLRQSGTYRVEWRAVADDGHVATGAFRFTLQLPAEAAGPGRSAQEEARRAAADSLRRHRVDPSTLPAALLPGSALNVGARLLQLAAIMALIGAAMLRTLLLPGAGLMPTVQHRLGIGIRRFAAGALAVLLITLPLRLWLESAALHGPSLAFHPTLILAILTDMHWGQAWAAQVLAALLAAVAVLTGFTPLLLVAAIGLAFTPPFQGHAVAVEPLRALAVTADGLHVLAAGAWIGTLAALVTTAVPILFRDGLERGGHDTARLLQRFSPLALVAAATLATAGTISAVLHFHDAGELLTTGYGRVLLLKLLMVLLVLLTGWYNWKRARPALPAHTAVRAVRRGALLELLFAAAALVVTAILVALPTP